MVCAVLAVLPASCAYMPAMIPSHRRLQTSLHESVVQTDDTVASIAASTAPQDEENETNLNASSSSPYHQRHRQQQHHNISRQNDVVATNKRSIRSMVGRFIARFGSTKSKDGLSSLSSSDVVNGDIELSDHHNGTSSNSSEPDGQQNSTSSTGSHNQTIGDSSANVTNLQTTRQSFNLSKDLYSSLMQDFMQIVMLNGSSGDESDAFSIGPYKLPMFFNTSSLPIVETAMSSVSGMMYMLNESLKISNGTVGFQVPSVVLVNDLQTILKSSGELDDATIQDIMGIIERSKQQPTAIDDTNGTLTAMDHNASILDDASNASDLSIIHRRASTLAEQQQPYSLGLSSASATQPIVSPPPHIKAPEGRSRMPHSIVKRRMKNLNELLKKNRGKHMFVASAGDHDEVTDYPHLLQRPAQNDDDISSIRAVDHLLESSNSTAARKYSRSTDPSKIYFASTGYALPYFSPAMLTVNATSLLESLMYKPTTLMTNGKRPTTASPPSAFATWSKEAALTPYVKPSKKTDATMAAATLSTAAATTTTTSEPTRELSPDSTVTVKELEAILERWERERFLSQSSLNGATGQSSRIQLLPSASSATSTGYSGLAEGVGGATKKSKSVAFPQPSLLKYKDLQTGTTVASALFGSIMATTLLPNLWLLGILAGAAYGYDITNNIGEIDPNSKDGEPKAIPSHIVARVLVGSGRRLAKYYLKAYDACAAMWFLYKTGQLSYQYYKTYEELDGKFKIQDKMDAWNARFQAGKVKFDKWEQDNEVGRRVLATLRTAWLVEEKTLRKGRKRKSRYRVVQYIFDMTHWCGRTTGRLYRSIVRGDGQAWNDFLTGIRAEVLRGELDTWAARVGAIVASLIAVNLLGSLYTISAPFVAIIATVLGLIWPTWIAELIDRIRQFGDDIMARGRGGKRKVPTRRGSSKAPATKSSLFTPSPNLRKDKKAALQNKKRMERKRKAELRRKRKQKENAGVLFPWERTEKSRRTPGKEQWGIFGRPVRN